MGRNWVGWGEISMGKVIKTGEILWKFDGKTMEIRNLVSDGRNLKKNC